MIETLHTLKILEKHSDSDHSLTQQDIIRYFETEYGQKPDRRAVKRYIDALIADGYDIVTGPKGCYLNEREFTNSELQLLIDGVFSSRYISAHYSKEIIGKLCNLTNEYFTANVDYIENGIRNSLSANRELFLNIESISGAIHRKKQIKYKFNKYGMDRKMHPRSEHIVTPYRMIVQNRHYYLMCYNHTYEKIQYHRIDHITDIKRLDEAAKPIETVPGFENGIDLKKIISGLPYMFSDGICRVELKVQKWAIDDVIDWFGTDITLIDNKDDKTVTACVECSPKAMSFWALQYVGAVEVMKPRSLREEVKKMLEDGCEKYQDGV